MSSLILKIHNITILLFALSIITGILFFITLSNCKGDCDNGNGTYIYPSGDVYKGDWKNKMRHGYGKLTFTNGSYKDGTWSYNKFENGYEFIAPNTSGFKNPFFISIKKLELLNIILGILSSIFALLASFLTIRIIKKNNSTI